MNDPIAEGLRTTPLDIITIVVWIGGVALLIGFLTTRKKRQRSENNEACIKCGASASADASYCTACGRDLSGRIRWYEWLGGAAMVLAVQALIGVFRLY